MNVPITLRVPTRHSFSFVGRFEISLWGGSESRERGASATWAQRSEPIAVRCDPPGDQNGMSRSGAGSGDGLAAMYALTARRTISERDAPVSATRHFSQDSVASSAIN